MLAFRIYSVIALCATAILAAPGTPKGRVCDGALSDSEVASAEAHFLAHANTTALNDDADRRSHTIPVYWHVIQKGRSTRDGHISESHMRRQIAVLNDAFEPAKLKFKLVGSNYKTNKGYFKYFGPRSSLDRRVKTALHQGTKGTLNIYSTGFVHVSPVGLLGYATWPWNVADALKLDGVVIKYSTIPRGSEEHYNEGKTLVHEVGHWLGLFHTFQGGCDGAGDLVSDTPAEAGPAYGCPINRDSCPNQRGLDPIHNYMDYTYDSCATKITRKQIKRIREQIATYRGIH